MSRPSTATVDYFPHVVKPGKTMFILESKFGNDGYATWFKILELLGSTNGHYIDCRDETNWQYLVAKCLVDENALENIIKTLVAVGAIDKQLWDQKVIFSQNFVDGIADVYKRRKVELPTKKSITTDINLVERDKCQQFAHSTNQSANENPQSKVKESKVNETTTIQAVELDDDWKQINKLFVTCFGSVPNSVQFQTIESYIQDKLQTWHIIRALEITAEQGKDNFSYTKAILNKWIKHEAFTPEDVKKMEDEYERKKASDSKGHGTSNQNAGGRVSSTVNGISQDRGSSKWDRLYEGE